MTAFFALHRIRFINTLQYRTAAFAGLMTQFAWGFMYILAFMAFYEANPYAFPMSLQQTVAYIWLQQAFMAIFFIWMYDNSIFEAIESGQISYELVRPMDLYGKWFVQTAATRMARALLRCLPLLAVAVVLPNAFRLVLPWDPLTALLFFVSMVLTLLVVIAFSMLIYISAFYTINSMGIRIVVWITADFLAGGMLPVPFFPHALRVFAELSPFGAMQNTPLLIFSGYLEGSMLVRALGLQVFWVAALVLIGRALMKKALSRVVVQGG